LSHLADLRLSYLNSYRPNKHADLKAVDLAQWIVGKPNENGSVWRRRQQTAAECGWHRPLSPEALVGQKRSFDFDSQKRVHTDPHADDNRRNKPALLLFIT
jgi:hypothetical protein